MPALTDTTIDPIPAFPYTMAWLQTLVAQGVIVDKYLSLTDSLFSESGARESLVCLTAIRAYILDLK